MMADMLKGSAESESVETKPLVNIVMAVYNPRMDWLREQLQSLNEQTYTSINIIARDDCSDKVTFEEIERCILEEITSFPVKIYRNDTNVGSNKTFELLTDQAGGEYIAYCDQDDVWLPEKIEKLVEFIEETKSQLVCSDVYVIDENGRTTAESVTKIRKRHIFKSGGSLASELLFRNFVIGCTMLIRRATAQESLPFVTDMVHDHYLALYAATKGKIGVCKQNLVKYRIHAQNQTNVLAGVNSKQDYYEVRIKPYLKRMKDINERFDIPKAREGLEWARAREHYYEGEKFGSTLWKMRELDKKTTMFELFIVPMPAFLFLIGIKAIQKGAI